MYNKHYWTKLSKQFNAHTEKSSWSNPKTIQIEHTSFFGRHVGMRGLNHNESSLLDFGTRIIEANAVYFAYNAKYKSVELYIQSTVHSGNAGTYVEFVKGGKTVSLTLYDNAEKAPWQIERSLGLSVETDLFQNYAQEEFKQALNKAGAKILVFFRFNQSIGLSLPHMIRHTGTPNYVKPTKQGVELGWISSGTYCSLPNVVKVKRVNSIQSVKLTDLGIERRGYYSHDLKCSIPKNQAKQAKRFFAKRFKAA